MHETTDAARLVRVDKGSLDHEELAALTAVLHSRATLAVHAPTAHTPRHHARSTAGWHRLERSSGYAGPRTWHAIGRAQS